MLPLSLSEKWEFVQVVATLWSLSSEFCLESCAGCRCSFLDDLRLDNFSYGKPRMDLPSSWHKLRKISVCSCCKIPMVVENTAQWHMLVGARTCWIVHKKPVTLFHHILGYFSNSRILATK